MAAANCRGLGRVARLTRQRPARGLHGHVHSLRVTLDHWSCLRHPRHAAAAGAVVARAVRTDPRDDGCAADRYLARHGLWQRGQRGGHPLHAYLRRVGGGRVADSFEPGSPGGTARCSGHRALGVASAGPGPACQLHRRPQQPRDRASAGRQRDRGGDAEIVRGRVQLQALGRGYQPAQLRLAQRYNFQCALSTPATPASDTLALIEFSNYRQQRRRVPRCTSTDCRSPTCR